ncbi:MAG TPA: arsenite methyltransferase [Oceanipulchritudo sp.]|nr:arsenite methyltransferase [Oceanipulchritudo sp.]
MKKTMEENTRDLVRSKYGEIARGQSCGCGQEDSACCYSEVGESYEAIGGYVPEADLGLGCGLPTEFAGIKEGDTVLDLGSGAGNDVFIARQETGATGRVIGVDFTPEMIALAEANRIKLGFSNIEFRRGEIEHLPVGDSSIDVVISNCVLNLVPDKEQAFQEIFRVLKPGGHFCVSDIVLEGVLPEKLRRAAELYVGCVAGALVRADYMEIINQQGFERIEVLKEREIQIPDEELRRYLDAEEIESYRKSGMRILSVTVRAGRPAC